MNIAVGPGQSSRQARIYRLFGLHAMLLDRRDGAHMNAAWGAYCRGGDDRWERQEFLANGNLCHFALLNDDEQLECMFGLEFCEQQGFPEYWVEFTYFAGSPLRPRGIMRRVAPAVVDICHWVSVKWCHDSGQMGVMRLTGRRGWSRILDRLRIERNEMGFIFENQERFRHGLQ